MKNSEKADIFFKVATEELNTYRSDAVRGHQDQTVLVNTDECKTLFSNSPYICDHLKDLVGGWASPELHELKEELLECGMLDSSFGVWNHIEAHRRQEARWFFLMLITEFLDLEGDN